MWWLRWKHGHIIMFMGYFRVIASIYYRSKFRTEKYTTLFVLLQGFNPIFKYIKPTCIEQCE